MSMDYCISETVKTTHMERLRKLALIYDIICEYGIHMDSRFLNHPGLCSLEDLEIIKAIGLFHVHGHISECLHRFATTYIPYLGVIDGEILETLWAVINRMSRSTRGATIAHRTEVLDDHMGDSNWKKTINIGESLSLFLEFLTYSQAATTIIKKYERAVKEQAEITKYFESLTESSPQHLLPVWTRDIEKAEASRQEDVTSMDYMNLNVEKRELFLYH